MSASVSQAAGKPRFPRQIKFIVGNEAAERFSFYGMRSILVIFMTQYLIMQKSDAKAVYHYFITAAYFFPLLGGYISDRYLGKYRTIITLSLVYCLGHAVLALFDGQSGLYTGLFLIALGAGGIKPCVSAHVGDQFDKSNASLLTKVFAIFYFSINFGAFFSMALIPKLLTNYGPKVAFAVPGVLMFIATWVFWMGRHYYVFVPPSGKEHSAQFFGILWHSLTHQGEKKPGQTWLDVSLPKYGAERVDGAKAVVNIFKVLASITAFWALFEQHGSSWVLQAQKMDRLFMGIQFEASQIPGLNPILIMIFVPIFNWLVYPAVEKAGIKVTPLRKIGAGMFMTGTAFIAAAILDGVLAAGGKPNIGWQFVQYLLVTFAEIMISITGLEFAYTQAPRAMKSTIMGLFFLTVSIGNLFTGIISSINPFREGMGEFMFYAGVMFIFSFIFVYMAKRYDERSYIESGGQVGH